MTGWPGCRYASRVDAADGMQNMFRVDVTGWPGCRYASRVDAAGDLQFYYIPVTGHFIRSLLTLP
ncbi:MAG: hypothetical protein R6U28_02815 [Cyclonatronaceae bacterium]